MALMDNGRDLDYSEVKVMYSFDLIGHTSFGASQERITFDLPYNDFCGAPQKGDKVDFIATLRDKEGNPFPYEGIGFIVKNTRWILGDDCHYLDVNLGEVDYRQDSQ